MKKSRKKLGLKTETVRMLSETALRQVQGAGWYTSCPTSAVNETCSDPYTHTDLSCDLSLSFGC